MEMRLNRKQYRAVTTDEEECFYIAGVGSGKSFVLGYFVLKEACLKGSVGLLTAPTNDTLNNSTMPALKEVWARLGLIEGTHYIIGSMPPPEWGVPNYTNRNSKILTWRWGAYTILDGSDNFNKHRGLEVDYVGADELRDIRPDAWEMYRSRMRGKAKKAIGAKYKMLACTTPPDNPKTVERLINDKVQVIRGTSFDNFKNLPIGYIEGLKARYDEQTYKREVLGELIYMGGTFAYYCFAPENIVKQDFDRTAKTIMCWDFNASAKKPMSTGLVQEINGKWYLTKEFAYKNSNTDEQCRKVKEFFDEVGFVGVLEVTGDYSGHRKESNASRSDYAIIEHYFRNYSNFIINTRPTLSVKDRIASLNAKFRNMLGERGLFVDSRCVKFIEDLQQTRWKESGMALDDTDPERTHLSDALSYFTHYYYRIGAESMQTS